jgi:hypothetical protein
MPNHFTTAQDYEQYRIDNPDDQMVLRGTGRRYQPITNGIGEYQRFKAEYIGKYGREKWEERCKEDKQNKL